MKTFKCRTMLSLSIALWSTAAWAATGFGEIGANLFGAIEGINSIIHVLAGLTGSALVLGSFFRYFAYRRNPIVAPLSSVIIMLLTGLCLIALIFIPIGQA